MAKFRGTAKCIEPYFGLNQRFPNFNVDKTGGLNLVCKNALAVPIFKKGSCHAPLSHLQHSALSTQHSALSTQHSALGLKKADLQKFNFNRAFSGASFHFLPLL